LLELKEIVGDLIEFDKDCSLLRLRLKCFSGFFGKILRENKKTLKQLQVVDRSSLVVQVMSEPEELSSDTYILFLSFRESEKREYVDTCELRFKGSTLKDLFDQVRLVSDEREFRLAKHVPHEFIWKEIDPEMIVT